MAKDAPFWSDAPMGCCHGYGVIAGNEDVFSVDGSAITFGAGALAEAGASVAGLGCKRVALFTDRTLAALEPVARVRASLVAAGLDVVVYDEVRVEPTDASFLAAAAFATEGRFDGYVSVGGGSVMDTCKAALLYATYPAPLEAYVNAPLGEGRAVPGPLPPHVACPTTCGTGSECTGIAVFDWLARKAKTGIASRRLRPTLALVDPTVTATLPAAVVAASGFDVLCHAIESYTARPYTARAKPGSPALRPMSQGRNPWSDVGALEALTLGGRFLVRAVRDATDAEARSELAWAATLAGIAFGNSGVHVPHAMSYAVSGLVRDFRMPGYPDEPLVPHGVSVVVSAPAVVRFTASSSPERHLTAAVAIGADVDGAGPGEVGDLLAEALAKLMRDADVPNGLRAVGYSESDLDALVAGTTGQKRLLDNAPRTVSEDDLRGLFTRSMRLLVNAMSETHAELRAAYRSFVTVPTRWMDNDVYGHVNNVVYYSWFDTAINRYLIREGGLDIEKGAVIGLCVESHCRYRRPITFPGDVELGLRVGKLGTSSVRYELGVFADGEDAAAAEGWFVHVFVDRDTRRSTPLPEQLRAALSALAGG